MENNKKYCHNCGTSIPNFAKFCTDCGTSQASLSAQPPRQSQQRPEKIITSFRPRILNGNDEDSEDELPQDRIRSIDDLGLTFAKENFGIEEPTTMPTQGKMTIGDVIAMEGVTPPAPISQRDVLSSPGSNTKEILQEFKETAGGVPTQTLGAGAINPTSRIRVNKV